MVRLGCSTAANLFTDLYFSYLYSISLNGRIESRENWTPARNWKLERVGGWGREKKMTSLLPPPRASRSLCSPFFRVREI